MQMKHSFLKVLTAVLLTASIPSSATTIGYTNGSVGRAQVFRAGSTTKQGMAMKLDGNKLKALKGQTITAIEAVFGSRNTTNNAATLFISTSPDGTPLYEQDVTISKSVQWLTFNLDKPYTITGDEGNLYIGYTLDIATTYNPLSADFQTDMDGVCYVYKDGAWTDCYGMGFGCVNVRAIVGDDFHTTDLTLKPIAASCYYKSGTAYSYSGEVFNFGTEAIKSFDVTLTIGDNAPQTFKYDGLNMASGSVYKFTLPEYTASTTGSMAMKVEVGNINGGTDNAPADNTRAIDVFFYPADMERTLLLEGFTGQACSNCPAGHRTIASALANVKIPVVEVMHHSGYQPDIFSMDTDYDYTFFYGSTSTYAPAVMINRTVNPAIGAMPVFNTGTELILNTIEMLSDKQPYVSLKLATDYNADTREAKIAFTAYVHNDLPSDINTLNVLLSQDGIRGTQSAGGDNYLHSQVFRGTLTGNSWGIQIPEELHKAGSTITWETTYTLPEAIVSDYWSDANLAAAGHTKDDITIATVPEDMYITAFVSAYKQNDVEGQEIYNCVQVKLGESAELGGMPTAIAQAKTTDRAEAAISVSGRRIVVDGADSYAIYNAAGQTVPTASDLAKGLYIVKAVAGGKATSKKVIIR